MRWKDQATRNAWNTEHHNGNSKKQTVMTNVIKNVIVLFPNIFVSIFLNQKTQIKMKEK